MSQPEKMDNKFPPMLEKKYSLIRELGQGAYGVVR
jgi:hypothetical protein